MPTTVFRYEVFLAMSGLELTEYMNQLDDGSSADESDILKVLSGLDSFDEEHLVYALKLGSYESPQRFATVLPRYLGHPKQSIRIVAGNALERLPAELLSTKLINDVRGAVQLIPVNERERFWSDLVSKLATRGHIGVENAKVWNSHLGKSKN